MSAQQSRNIKAAVWTIGVHVLLLLLFIFWHYTLPIATAAPVEMGMEVNLGTSDNGSGTDQPMNTEDPAANAAAVATRNATAASNPAQDMMQSTDKDAPSVEPANDKTLNSKNNTVDAKPIKNPQQQQGNDKTNKPQQPKYVYNGGTGKGGNSASENLPGGDEGNTTGHGDRGVPGGTPGASNYTGSPGTGNGGISHTLTGRRISPDRFEAAFHEGGTVVVSVTVNQSGEIISKRIVSSPSAELSHLAMQKLSQAKFSANPDAAPQQFGKVTIVFKSRS